jgi:hypothetical protein
MHFLSTTPLADVPNFGNSIIHGLAVAGAGAVGYGLTFFVLWLISKFAFNKRLPAKIRRPICLLGALATGIFVWMLLFHSGGGGGWGFGPGVGFGTGTEDSKSGIANNLEHVIIESTKPSESKKIEETAAAPLRILMLGGDRVKGSSESELTYYQLLPESRTYTLKEIKEVIRQRIKANPSIHGIAIVVREDSVAHEHPAVKQLEDFAKDEGLAISYPAE